MGRVFDTVRGLAMLVNITREARSFLEGYHSKIQFDLEGEEAFYVALEDGRMRVEGGEADSPTTTITGDAEIFYKVITGEIDQDEAFANRLYEVQGSIKEAVLLRYIGELVQRKRRRLIDFLQRFRQRAEGRGADA